MRGAVKPVIETAKAAELLLLAALARLDSFPPCEAPSRGLFPVQMKCLLGAILAGFRDLLRSYSSRVEFEIILGCSFRFSARLTQCSGPQSLVKD